MARLSIGVDVAGATKIEQLSRAVKDTAAAVDVLNVSMAKLKSAGGGSTLGGMLGDVRALKKAYVELSAVAKSAETALQRSMSGSTYGGRAQIEAQVAAVGKLSAIHTKYVQTLATQRVLENSTAKAITKKTAAIEAQNLALAKLNTLGVTPVTGGNYVKQLAEMERLAAARAALGSGANQAAILAEERLAAARAALGSGANQAAILAEERLAAARAALVSGANQAAILSEERLAASRAALAMGANQAIINSEARVAAARAALLQGNYQAQILAETAAFGRMTKQVGLLHGALRGAAGAMGSLWMTYGAILPLLAGFSTVASTIATIKKGAEFDYDARSIEILTYGYETLSKNADLATASLEKTKEAILSIEDVPFAAGDLAEGLLEFSRAGFKDFEQNLINIGQAAKFAYIGHMELPKAIELVVGQMTAFKDVGKDAGKAYNVMAVVADQTSINLQQMAEAFKNTTSLGTVMGLKFDDVATAIGVLGQAGIRGATAGAALNTMMYKLIAPTATAAKKMKELGVSFEAFDEKTGAIKSIKQIAFELADLTKYLNSAQTAEVFESMAGLRGVKALGALVQMARESSDEFEKLSASVAGSGTYLDGYFSLLKTSGKTQIALLKAEFDKLFTANYDNSKVVKMITSLRDLVKSKDVAGGVSFVTSAVIGLVDAVGRAAISIGKLGGAIANFPGFKFALAAQSAVFNGILNKIEQVGEAVDWISDKFREAAEYLPDWAKAKLGLKTVEDGAVATGEAAKNAKAELAKLAGIELKRPDLDLADAEKLAKVEDYFNRIQDKILDINRTPLQVVDKQIQEDVADMWQTLASGGLSLEEQAKVSAGYVKELQKLSTEAKTAETRIERLKEQFDNAKDSNAKRWIAEVIANFTKLAEAAKKKELEKATEEMLAGMRKEWQGYAKDVRKIQDDIAKSQRDLTKEINDIDKGHKKGYELWKDDEKDVKSYEQEAIKALTNIKKLRDDFAKAQAKLSTPGLSDKDKAATMDEMRLLAAKMQEISSGPLKEALGDMASTAKNLNTEVNGVTSAMEKQLAYAERTLASLQAQKAAVEASGRTDSVLDAKIKYQEAVVKALEAQKKQQETQILVSPEQASKITKEYLTKVQGMSKEAADIISGTLGNMMNQLGSDASKLGMGPVDMTEGMDATSAAWIKKWQETTDATSQATKKSVDEIQTKIGEIRMPTEEWLTSIFTMKGVFIEAVDEMSRKAEAGGKVTGTGKIYTNAIPGKNPIVDNAAAQAAAIMSQLEAERNKNIAAAAQAAAAAGQTQATAIEAGAQRGAQYMQQGIVTGASEATTETQGNLSGGGIDEAINKVNKLQAEIERLTDQSTWGNIDWMAAFAEMPDSSQAESYFDIIKKSLLDMTADSDEFVESWEKGWEDSDKASKEVMDSIIDRLDYITSKTFYVDIEYRENRSLGGLIGGFQLGGYIQKLADGGGVRNMLQGAYLPGYGGGDRRLILGEDGEFMIRKEMVRAAGRDVAADFNAGKWGRVVDKLSNRFLLPNPSGLTGYSSGGYIQTGPGSAGAGGYSQQTQVVMNFADSSETAVLYGSDRDIDVFSRAMARKARLRSS